MGIPVICKIGGAITPEQLKKITEAGNYEGGSLEWGGSSLDYDEVLESVTEDGVLEIMNDQSRSGALEELTLYLESCGIPYIVQCDGRDECDAEITWYNGTASRIIPSDQTGSILVSEKDTKKAIEMIRSGKYDDAVSHLEFVSAKPEIPAVCLAS